MKTRDLPFLPHREVVDVNGKLLPGGFADEDSAIAYSLARFFALLHGKGLSTACWITSHAFKNRKARRQADRRLRRALVGGTHLFRVIGGGREVELSALREALPSTIRGRLPELLEDLESIGQIKVKHGRVSIART